MENETVAATATQTPDASASTEASATLLATAGNATDKTQQTQTTETPAAKPPETPATDATKTETTSTAVVPEKYDFKAPEGTEYDAGILESFTGAAKEAGLSQDAAQKVLERMAPALAARQVDQVQAIHKEWLDASTADKEFGGDKLTENLGVARKALENFGSPDLRKLLDETGLGNHPEVIRFMYRAGKAISEDKFVGGSARGTGATNPAAVLYDKTTQKG
jgi:hypothetical protein